MNKQFSISQNVQPAPPSAVTEAQNVQPAPPSAVTEAQNVQPAPPSAVTIRRTAAGFIESEGARAPMVANPRITPEVTEAERMGFITPGTHLGSSSRAQTARSLITGIRADLGETAAYNARLARGEIGLLAPMGSNIPGPDYLTAAREPDGLIWIYVCDTKSRVSANSPFGRVRNNLPQTWRDTMNDALSPSRLNLENPALEGEIRDALLQGRVRIKQDNVDFSTGNRRVDLDVQYYFRPGT
jgi:hypothetical protein